MEAVRTIVVVCENEREFNEWSRENRQHFENRNTRVVRVTPWNYETRRGLHLGKDDRVEFIGVIGEMMAELRIAGWKP